MTYHDVPILEFDPANDAALDPHRLIERIDMPEHCARRTTTCLRAVKWPQALKEWRRWNESSGREMLITS
jgi:hypothetical protein